MSEQSQKSESLKNDDESVGADRLRGCVEIGGELRIKPENVPYLAKTGDWPIVKNGKFWESSKQLLRAHHRNKFKVKKST